MTWKHEKFSSICDFVRGPFGGSLKKNVFKPKGYAVYEQQHAIYDQFTNIRYFVDEDKFFEMSRFELFSGDLIMSCSGTMGRVAIVPEGIPRGIINQALLKLSPNKKIVPKFLKLWMESDNFQAQINSLSQGVAIKNMASVKLLKQIMVPTPHIQEQKRIVAILDQAFADIEKIRANTEKNLKNARELFESYANKILFSSAKGWLESTIGNECELMTGGTPSKTKAEYFNNGTIRWLVSGDVHKEIINDCDGRITKLGMANSNTKYLPINSVVIALNGQGKTRGTVALLKVEATCNQSIVSISPKKSSRLLSEYILLNLQSRYNEIRKITGDSGNDRRGLNMPLIRKIKISFPCSYEEQKNIINHLNILKTLHNDLFLKYQKKINYLDQLKKSILHKAFTGQLIKQEQEITT